MTNRQLQALATKENIVNVAKILFENNGYDSVSIDSICSQCNISKGAFYHHFTSKDDIILWIIRMGEDQHLLEAVEPFIDKEDTLSLLKRYIESFNQIESNIAALKQYFRILPTRENGKEELERRNAYKLIYAIIEKGQKRGDVRKDISLEYCVNLFAACMSGIYLHWCIYNNTYSIREFSNKVIHDLYKMIKA